MNSVASRSEAEVFAEVRDRMEKLAQKIGASSRDLPTFGESIDGAHPNVEYSEGCYSYVVVERGLELRRRTTRDVEELLYWTFSDITCSMASAYAAGKERFREVMFRYQLRLMSNLNEEWRRCEELRIRKVLDEYPLVEGR